MTSKTVDIPYDSRVEKLIKHVKGQIQGIYGRDDDKTNTYKALALTKDGATYRVYEFEMDEAVVTLEEFVASNDLKVVLETAGKLIYLIDSQFNNKGEIKLEDNVTQRNENYFIYKGGE